MLYRTKVEIITLEFEFQSSYHVSMAYLFNRAFQSVLFNSGQKMALRSFYFKITETALTYSYTNRSQRHLLTANQNKQFRGPINVCLLKNIQKNILYKVKYCILKILLSIIE